MQLVALMEWERKARKALVSPELVCFLRLAKMATPRTGHLWPKCFRQIHILIKIFVVAVAYCPFNHHDTRRDKGEAAQKSSSALEGWHGSHGVLGREY